MASRTSDVTDTEDKPKNEKEVAELPPSGTSLHKRRRGEHPVTLNVKSPQTPSDAEGSSPFTASPYQWKDDVDPNALCDGMLQRLKDLSDPASKRGKELATKTKDTIEALDQLEKLLELLDQFLMLKEQNNRILKRLGDVNHLKRLHSMRKKVALENERMKDECNELEMIDEATDLGLEMEYGQALFDSIIAGRSMKRTGSKWKSGPRFGGSLLRKQRSRSAGGDDSDVTPGTPLRRRSEGIFCKEVEKSKVSKWTRVKAAFKWEKALWQPGAVGGVAAVAAGAMVGAVALAGSTPGSATLPNPERDSTSLTPGSALSLTPNSSCEELRMDPGTCRKSGIYRCDENDNTFLHAPPQDDSSTSPSPNKLHKSPWVKMRDIIQTRRESVKKKTRASKSSPDVVPLRRRSFSDGGDSDAPPVLTLTIPSSEELESEPCHPVLRKQRSLELGARPPQHRPPRASKWTKVKRAFLTSASASMPSSPSRHSAFFTDADTEGLSSGCEASAREEIARNYAALQSRLSREISDRHGKLNAASRPTGLATEESANIRKKWQNLQGGKPPPTLPTREDLSEDFQKKLDEWTHMKDTNSVPAWERKAKPDEILVKTSTGLFKFHGISRSFTRKLHEWEKSRGIAPEASTSALLEAAKGNNPPPMPLTRAQSDGSVAPSIGGSGRLHASSLSVNDADDFDSEYDREHCLEGTDETDDNTRGAVLVEVDPEEVCTAAPLVAVAPRHAPQRPVYTYGRAEARLLCETSSAVTATAQLRNNAPVILSECRDKTKEQSGAKQKSSRDQTKSDISNKRNLGRQPSIEEDALFIRKTIEEIERGSSSRLKEDPVSDYENAQDSFDNLPSTSKITKNVECIETFAPILVEDVDDFKKKDFDKSNNNNGKKKSKSRARLEREQSKPSESDTEQEVDTVTVEIPRRRKRPRRSSENPKKAQSFAHTESEEDVFVLKLKAPEQREGSPEVIVKTTRKIFSPVVRSGESVPRSVIPVDVDDLAVVRPSASQSSIHETKSRKRDKKCEREKQTRSKSSSDLQEVDDQKTRTRPPLPTSPSSQRKPQPKETAPSIRIMIQRYNMKINEEGHTSGASSGASSPAWRSPAAERRRPPDMPVGVNIKNNPFLEKEVQKSASACQLSRRDQTSSEKRHTPTPPPCFDGVPKSHSTNALHPDQTETKEEGQETTDTKNEPIDNAVNKDTIPDQTKKLPDKDLISRQLSDTVVPTYRLVYKDVGSSTKVFSSEDASKLSERAVRIKAARERFLSSPAMRREGTSSASDLRPGDRSSRISCESDVTESQSQGSEVQESPGLGRSASTGMVNVDREAWQRVTDGGRRENRTRSRFSLARLAAKLRRKDDGAISRLCRQSLLVQLRNKQ